MPVRVSCGKWLTTQVAGGIDGVALTPVPLQNASYGVLGMTWELLNSTPSTT